MVNNLPHESELNPYNDIHRFFEFSLDLFGISGFDGFLKRVNSAWEKVLGYSVDELLSRPLNEFVHPDDQSATLSRREQTKAGSAINNFENRLIAKDGSVRWIEWTAHPYPEQGVNYIVGRDVSERKRSENIVLESEARFRSMADVAPILIWISDQNRDIIYYNRHWVEYRNAPIEQDLGDGWKMSLHPDDVERVSQMYVEAFDSRQLFVAECRLRHASGDYHWVVLSAAPRFTPDGEFLGYVGTVVDIHDRKLAENALRQMLNSTNDVVSLTDLDNRLVAFNDAFVAVHHRAEAELVGQSLYDLLPPENAANRKRFSELILKTGQSQHFTSQIADKYLEHSMNPVFDDEGKMVGIAMFSHDITHLKQTEDALRYREEQFRSVFESATEGLLVTNQAGEILLLNPQIEQIFGYKREELIGQSVDVLLPESLRSVHPQHRQEYMANPVVRPMGAGRELFGRRKDGVNFPAEISLSFNHNHEGIQVIVFITDITERKQIEEQRLQQQRQHLELQQEREILELRQRFMSMVSHEFRTPLTVIASSCELLVNYYDRLPKERQIEKLHIINGQVRAMVGLLDDILQLGKIQANAVDFVPEILDLVALSTRVLSTIQIIDQHHHQLQLQLSDFVPPVKADRRMLEHAVGNLLSNAVKYSPPGSKVEFSLSGHGKQVRMEIRDEGMGIPLEDQPHLFEPFYRAQNARQIEGTGLGLAIVKHNIEKHGGTIRCHSIEGAGTTFTIELPAEVSA